MAYERFNNIDRSPVQKEITANPFNFAINNAIFRVQTIRKNEESGMPKEKTKDTIVKPEPRHERVKKLVEESVERGDDTWLSERVIHQLRPSSQVSSIWKTPTPPSSGDGSRPVSRTPSPSSN